MFCTIPVSKQPITINATVTNNVEHSKNILSEVDKQLSFSLNCEMVVFIEDGSFETSLIGACLRRLFEIPGMLTPFH